MRLLERLLIVPFGLILAVPAGFLTLVIGSVREPAIADLVVSLANAGTEALLAEMGPGGLPAAVALEMAYGLWLLGVALLLVPPTLTALVGEAVGARSLAFYGTLCGGLTAALPWLARAPLGTGGILPGEGRITALLFVTGAAAGLVYWAVAGRGAGATPRERIGPTARPHSTGA